jgi:hypothetical protein
MDQKISHIDNIVYSSIIILIVVISSQIYLLIKIIIQHRVKNIRNLYLVRHYKKHYHMIIRCQIILLDSHSNKHNRNQLVIVYKIKRAFSLIQ